MNLTEWGKSVKVAPNELNLRLLGFRLHSVIYGEPTKSSLKFIRNKIHPTGLQWTLQFSKHLLVASNPSWIAYSISMRCERAYRNLLLVIWVLQVSALEQTSAEKFNFTEILWHSQLKLKLKIMTCWARIGLGFAFSLSSRRISVLIDREMRSAALYLDTLWDILSLINLGARLTLRQLEYPARPSSEP